MGLCAIILMMSSVPRYLANTSKALEVILYIANRKQGFDIYHVVKAGYFADKFHISNYGRPITGDTYEAGPYGPLPKVMYGLLRRDPIELLALESNGALPLRVGQDFKVYADREPNLRKLSGSDVKALDHGIAHVADKTFEEIYSETHADPAYFNAQGDVMDYREFIDDTDPQKSEKSRSLEESAGTAVF
jgi:hypothetical protein